MGYEKCGRKETYPYSELLDGKPHIIGASDNQIRTLRYGARRRSLRLTVHTVSRGTYQIMALHSRESSRG